MIRTLPYISLTFSALSVGGDGVDRDRMVDASASAPHRLISEAAAAAPAGGKLCRKWKTDFTYFPHHAHLPSDGAEC